MLWVLMFTESSASQIPSLGADRPAIVMSGWLISRALFKRMIPATRKTTKRGPSLSTAARRLPGLSRVNAQAVASRTINWRPRDCVWSFDASAGTRSRNLPAIDRRSGTLRNDLSQGFRRRPRPVGGIGSTRVTGDQQSADIRSAGDGSGRCSINP